MIVEEFKVKRKINIKLIVVILIILVLISTFIILYKFSEMFRNRINNMLKFTVENNNSIATIYIQQDMVNSVFGYDKYFSILSQNSLIGYTSSDKEEYKYTTNINNCISSNRGKYLVLSEYGMNHFYLYCGKELVYEKEISENISDIYVNKNGYVALSCEKSGYRSIIKLFNPNGEEVFTTYLATTYASDVCISDNNKYLAIAEIDTSGMNVQSSIKVIETAKANSENFISNINTEIGIITHMVFVNNKEIIYLTNNEIKQIDIDKNKKSIFTINSNILNVDISSGNHIVLTERKTSALFNSDTDIIIINRDAKEVGRYTIQGNIKQIVSKNNIISANVGQKIFFLTMTGRPIKEYSANMDVKNVIIFNNGNKAGIIYRNKMEIIDI